MSGKQSIPNDEVDLVRLLWTGNDGVVRGRSVSASAIDAAIDRGVTFPRTFQSVTYTGKFAADGPFDIDDEALLVPEISTYQRLPYADSEAAMICNLCTMDGTLSDADPRSRLVELLGDLSSDGISVVSGFESEFYLTKEVEDTLVPVDDTPNMSVAGMRTSKSFVHDLVDALSAQGLGFSSYHAASGPGQQEVLMEPQTDITAADNQILYCQTVREVAVEHGLHATLSPKPFEERPPSGCHLNLSLWEGETNLFYDSTEDGAYPISETCRHFVGGLLEHASALVALTVPNVDSYRRIRKSHASVPTSTCWGLGNREALVRIPGVHASSEGESNRVEFKAVDNTTNPYLALSGVLAAGMDGVENEISPGEPVEGDPDRLSSSERENRDIEPLPNSLDVALDALESDSVLSERIGEKLVESYVAVKRRQWDDLVGDDHAGSDSTDEFRRIF